MNPLLEAASAALPIVNAIPQLLASTSSNADGSSTTPLRDDRIAISGSDLPPAPTPTPSTTISQRVPGVDIPFQHLFYDLTGSESGHTSITIPTIPSVACFSKFFRDVSLLRLEAAIYSSYPAYTTPVTVDLAWTPANVTLGSDVLHSPGGVRFTVGGLNITDSGILPCNLSYMNPIIKSPVPYDNHPRLNVRFHLHKKTSAQAPIAATIIIRGVAHCAHPTIYSV